MFGCKSKAQELATWVADRGGVNREGGNAPDGWTFVGAGAYRNAYRHDASGIVYKIDRNRGVNLNSMGSHAEHAHASKARKMNWTDRVRIPQTALFKFGAVFIIAMEQPTGVLARDADGDLHRLAQAGYSEMTNVFWDMHDQNYYIEPSGTVVPIDMGGME